MSLGLLLAQSDIWAQTYSNREVAVENASHDITKIVYEPALAVSPTRVLVVFIEGGPEGTLSSPRFIGYAHRPVGGGAWTRGHLAHLPGTVGGEFDPAVAYDSTSGKFLVTALSGLSEASAFVVTATFDDTTGEFEGGWANTFVRVKDKPWIIRGDATDEFYILFMMESVDPPFPGYGVIRTQDGGETWYPQWTATEKPLDATLIKVANIPVVGDFCIQPTLGREGKVYAPYMSSTGDRALIRFVEGVDSGEGVTWSYLRALVPGDGPDPVEEQPLSLRVLRGDLMQPVIPWCAQAKGATRVPWLAADASVDRLYLVYHDVAGVIMDEYDDANVYLRVLTREPPYWSVGPAVPLNRDLLPSGATDPRNDQVLPTITLDSTGRLHAIWYDERNFPQNDCSGCVLTNYDVFHAGVTNLGTFPPTIQERQLCGDQAACPVLGDVGLGYGPQLSDDDLRPGEYSGLAAYTPAGGNPTVWAAFTGSTPSATGDPSLIYVVKIQY